MVSILLLSSIILFLFFFYGNVGLVIIRRVLASTHDDAISFPLVLIVGEIIVAVFAMIAQLFIPLGNGVFITSLIALAVLFAINNRNWFFIRKPSYTFIIWIIFVLTLLTILENVTHVPANPDTGLYHAQSIRWFETYRIVPGLGNFEARYAFNSSWLVLNAALSFVFLGISSFRLINGVTFFIAVLYFGEGVIDVANRNMTISSVLKMLFLPLGFYLLNSEISSVGNDMPVTFLTWILVLLWLEKMNAGTKSGIYNALIVLISMFLITVKLSFLPLLLFSVFIGFEYWKQKQWQIMLFLGAMSMLVLLPWMVRSIFLSGYLVFPQTQIDLFNFDWKMRPNDVDFAVQGIIGIARLGNSWNPSVPLSFSEWVPKWFNRFTFNRQILMIGASISPLLMAVITCKSASKPSRGYLLAFGVMFVGVVFWFFTAPGIRFGYGSLVSLCSLAVAPIILSVFVLSKKIFPFFFDIILILLAVFQFYILWHSIDVSTLSQRLLLPADYPPSVTSPCDLDGIIIGCRPDGIMWTQCFYDVFPCATVHHIEVKMRGETFQDGFKPVETMKP